MHTAGDILKGRYVIRGILGSGGSGCVYLGEDFGVGKLWAIKEIDLSIYGSRRFAESEICMLKAIDHPSFPRITDAWQDNDHFIIVSDYIEGISLGRLLSGGPLSKIKAYKFAHQIAEALEYLHSNNPPILFLDLKPDNIMVKPDGRIYLIDFGISAFLSGLGGGFGTKGFAPPEQYKKAGDLRLDERADVYAFGQTFLSMRCGIYPEADAAVQKEFVNGITSLSKSEKQFILKCTHIDPPKRLRSMRQVKKYLDRIYFFTSYSKRRAAVAAAGFLVFLTMITLNITKKTDYTSEMLKAAAEYTSDGEYTEEGLRVIENYINSGLLSRREEGCYCFMVGRTYFEKYRNYREAERYFEKLDADEYPEKNYYLEMCALETGFDYDEKAVYESLVSFREDVMKDRDNEEKYENLLFIAFCFDNYCAEENGKREALKTYDYIKNSLMGISEKKEWAKNMSERADRERKNLNGPI